MKKSMKCVWLWGIAEIFLAVLLQGCGGGGSAVTPPASGGGIVLCDEPPPRSFSAAQVQAMTPNEFQTLNDLEVIGLGANFDLLSNNSLMAIQSTVANKKIGCYHDAQITAITPEQIALLTPTRVRLLGIGYPRPVDAPPAKLEYLNEKTFRALVAKSLQVEAFTDLEIASLSSDKIPMFGDNIASLSNDALGALKYLFTTSPHNLTSQIGAITPAQVLVLSPAQVRWLGNPKKANVARVANLSVEAFKQLVNGPYPAPILPPNPDSARAQVEMFTAEEVKSLDSVRIPLFGTNLRYLDDLALNALKDTVLTNQNNPVCQVTAIEAAQIEDLPPAKVRQIGADPDGQYITNPAARIARIGLLSEQAWRKLMEDKVGAVPGAQVSAIMKNEFYPPSGSKLSPIPAVKIPQMGASFKYLSNDVLGAIPVTFTPNLLNPTSPFNAITALQLAELNAIQVVALVGGADGTRLGYMTLAQLGALAAPQVGGLTPANVRMLTAQQLASFPASAFSDLGFSRSTKDSFTAAQKSLLSPSQKSQCGC